VFSNRFVVIPDACVLADVAKRDLILTLAEAGLFRLRWSDRILDETEGAITRILQKNNTPNAEDRAKISVAAMRRAFPEAMNNGYEDILGTLKCLPDDKDHHVLAVAIRCKAAMIATDNLKDFPAKALAPYALEANSADEFIADTIDLDYLKSIPTIKAMRAKLKNPAMTAEELVERWRERGMTATAEIMAPHIPNI
jgi:predicted nucleic acid-binding protein